MGIIKYVGLLLLLHLFLIMTIISCNGQEKSTESIDAVKFDSIKSPSSDINYSLSLQNKDPLFYLDGQLCAWVRNIYQDRKGNLWFGTNHYGVMRYDGDTLEYFDEHHGLGDGRVNDIEEDAEGMIWFATYGGLTKFDGQSFKNIPINNDSEDQEVTSICIDSDDLMWIGTRNGILTYDEHEFSSFQYPKAIVKDTSSILSYNGINCIMEDSSGNIWIGTDGFGICMYNAHEQNSKGNRFVHLTKKDGLGDNNIGSITEDKAGNIWIGTMHGGMSRFDGNAILNYTDSGKIQGVETGALFEDSHGNMWMSSEGYGVYQYDGKFFKNFHLAQGLNSNGIISILEDREGRYWLGGWGGLFRYYPELSKSLDQPIIPVTRFGPWK